MFTPRSHRALHDLPAYLAGTLPSRRRDVLEQRLAGDPGLRAECDRLAALAACLQAHDPASPVDPSAAAALKQRLHAELDQTLAQPARPVWQPVLAACSAAALLFVAGCVTGAKLFPNEVVREVVKEQRVAVAVPVPVLKPVTVEKIVEKRVEVPVEKVVTRWRTRTVTRTVVVERGASKPDVRPVVETPAPRPQPQPTQVVNVPAEAGRPAAVGVAMVSPGPRTGVVDF